MNTERTVHHLYGVHLADDTDWAALEDDLGYCMNNGAVGLFRAGPLDGRRTYLALRWEKIELGEEVFHSGVHAVASKFERDRWNDDLAAVVDQFGLRVERGPGWFTIHGEV